MIQTLNRKSLIKLKVLVLIILFIHSIESFTVSPKAARAPLGSVSLSRCTRTTTTRTTARIMSSTTNNTNEPLESTAAGELLPDPKSMRIKEIKNELDSLKVKYNDCFDKESLCLRLTDAREGKIPIPAVETAPAPASASASVPTGGSQATKSNSNEKSNFDKEQKAQELRSMRVKELRTKCAEYGIRWASMIEKEELVQALVTHYEKVSSFSPSGTIVPGKVAVINDELILEQELSPSSPSATPLLLDVYAVWCGPCKLMAPQLDDAAEELGDLVRVAKIDSDKFPEWSSKLNVSGLPTIIVFDGMTGRELQRVEGALMKDDLVKLALSHVKN